MFVTSLWSAANSSSLRKAASTGGIYGDSSLGRGAGVLHLVALLVSVIIWKRQLWVIKATVLSHVDLMYFVDRSFYL